MPATVAKNESPPADGTTMGEPGPVNVIPGPPETATRPCLAYRNTMSPPSASTVTVSPSV